MSSQAEKSNTASDIRANLLQIQEDDLSRDTAESLLSVQFDERDVTRVNQLSALAREGTLSTEEHAELERYLQTANLLAMMQSKARRCLKNSQAA